MDPENKNNSTSRQNSAKSVKSSHKQNNELDNTSQNNTEKSQNSRQNSAKTDRGTPTQNNNNENGQNSPENASKTDAEPPLNTTKSPDVSSDQSPGNAENAEQQNSTETGQKNPSRQNSAMEETTPADNSSQAPASPIQNDTEDEEPSHQNTAINSERESRQNSAGIEQAKPEVNGKSENNSRKNSAVSTKLPYLDTERKQTTLEDSRMYSPDDGLTIDEFMKNLQEDNLQLTKELEEWRDKYGVENESEETENILAGKPSLKGLGLNDEEEKIAHIVVKSKMSELGKMSTQELVDFVRMSSY